MPRGSPRPPVKPVTLRVAVLKLHSPLDVTTYAVVPCGENSIWLGEPCTGIVPVTLFVAVSMTLIFVGDDGEVCGPVSATHSWLPSGVTARACGLRPTWMSVSAGLQLLGS